MNARPLRWRRSERPICALQLGAALLVAVTLGACASDTDTHLAGRQGSSTATAPQSPSSTVRVVAEGATSQTNPAPGNPATNPETAIPGTDADMPVDSTAPGQVVATATAPPTVPPPPPGTSFAFATEPISAEIAARVTGSSWRPGCPEPLENLRYVRLTHVTFEGTIAEGELIVRADVVADVETAFRTMFEQRFPIRSMRLVDDFGADDLASVAADNTSAFNCRPAYGSTSGFSRHSYGIAIDINPVENPYVVGREVIPSQGAPFVSRATAPGVISPDGPIVAVFDQLGWGWGGRWRNPDYQHFSASGG